MESYKQEKIIIIMYEYLNDKREFYPISNVPLDKAKFFYKDDDGLFKLMAVSDYTVKTELNENRLYIVNAAIKDNSEKFQIGYEINFKAAEYESPLPVLSVLTKMYNQLIEDTRILHSYIRKQCFVADGKEQALVLPGLPAHTVWCMGENGKMFALPVSELYERFGNLIKTMEKILDEYIEQKKEEIRGPAGAIDNVTASVNSNAGTPKVTVSLGGTPERRKIDLKFENLKGDKPIKGTDYYTEQEKEQFTTETLSLVTAEGTKQVKAVTDKGSEQTSLVIAEGNKQISLTQTEALKVIEQLKKLVEGNPETSNAQALSGKTRIEFERDTQALAGKYDGNFPLASAVKGAVYLVPTTGKFYICNESYSGKSLSEPNENFEELSVFKNREKFENSIAKTRVEFENDLAYTNNAVFKEEYKDITSEYHITHPDKYCAITNNRDSIYNTILNETAECVVNVYKVKKGDKFKVTSVLSMGNFPVCIYLDSDFRLIQKTKKLPSNFGYSQQTNEFIVDNDYPYVLLTSRYTALFKVEKVLLISKVPTKTSELINDNNFIIHKDMEKYVDNKFITVNQSINLYDSSKSIEGFMSEKDKIEVNSSYMTSDFIKLEKGNYVIQQDPKINETARITYTTYDRNKKPVTFLNKANINNLVVNMNTDGYLRFSTYTKQMQRRAMVFKGEQPLTEYIAFKTFESLNENITSDNILWNKKWAVCGDSFTNGVTETKIKSGRYEGKQYTYPYLIGNRQNMDIRCFFRGGRTLAYPKDGSFNNSLTCPTSEAYYKNIPVDVDYITIYLGINDSHHATGSSGTDGEVVTGVIPIGTIDDIDTSTYYGAWNVILTWLIENRPFAHIGIIVSNGCDTPEYRTAQLSIAKKYGIPYIDLNGDERTPCMIRSQNQKISKTIRNMITKKQAVDFDGTLTGSVNLHPNDQAHLYESYFIENFLRNL